MEDENQAQESEQEQEQAQEAEPVQEPAEKPRDKPAKKESGGGILLPILYALLAAVGAFTLVLIAGIVWTIITRPADPSESPSTEPSIQITQTQSYRSPDPEGLFPYDAV